MFKCMECGKTFEEPAKWTEPHVEEMTGCPVCKGDYEEMEKCPVCNGEYAEDDFKGGVCKNCYDEAMSYRHDLKACYKASQHFDKEKVEINTLLTTQFTESEINMILFKELSTQHRIIQCDFADFIDADPEGFLHYLKKEGENEKK